MGGLLTYFFYCLSSPWQRGLTLTVLLSFFAISPIIYLVVLTRMAWFNQLPVLLQSIQVLWLNMSPLAAIMFIFSLGKLASGSLESAIMTARPTAVLRHIVFPQIRFSIIGTFLIIFMLTFIHEEVPSFLGYRTYAEEFLVRVVAMESYREASLASLPFLCLGTIVYIILALIIRGGNCSDSQIAPRLLMQTHLNLPKIHALIGSILLLTMAGGLVALLVTDLNLRNVEQLLTDNAHSIQNTFTLSLVSAITATLCGGLLYRRLIKGAYIGELAIWGGIMMFYWLTPSSLNTLALIQLTQVFHCNSMLFDYLVLCFGYLLKLLPISLFLFVASDTMTSTKQDIFFRFINISTYNKFRKITLPQRWHMWLFICAMLSVFAMNEVSTTVLLIPPGVETIVVRIYNLMHYGDFSSVAFLSLMQVLLIVICVITTQLIMRAHDYT